MAYDLRSPAELLWTASVTAVEVGDEATAREARDRLASLHGDIEGPFLHAVALLAISWSAPIDSDLDAALSLVPQSVEELRGQDERGSRLSRMEAVTTVQQTARPSPTAKR